MDERLSQAVTAARAGQKKEAQQLLAQLLEDNPDETQGWFLLSNLVEDPTKKQVFLGRVLALEPDHAMATTQWAEMHPSEPADVQAQPTMPVSTSDDPMDQAEGGTLPSWLADDSDNLRLDESGLALAAELDELTAETDEEIPGWLSDEPDIGPDEENVLPSADDEEPETAVPAKQNHKTLTTAPTIDGKARPTGQERNLTVMLYILSGVAVLVFLALIYLVITNL